MRILLPSIAILTSSFSTAALAASSGFPPVFQLDSIDGTNGFRAPGLATNDISGHAISKIGDMNGDGIDDFLIAAPTNHWSDGRVFVVFGKAGGLPATVDLTTLDGQNGFSITDPVASTAFGMSASGAGDMNGDGLGDVIIGAPDASPNSVAYAGSAYVIFGKSTGFPASISVADLDGSNGFRVDGGNAVARAGTVVAALGDINHDGLGDVGINSPGAAPQGAVYLIFGKSTGFTAIVAAPVLGDSNVENSYLECTGGCDAVSGVGDFNGDHIDDFAVGLQRFDRLHVFLGMNEPYWKSIPEAGLIHNSVMFTGSAESPQINYRQVISAAGDVNGDGFDDFVVGQPETTVNGLQMAGRASVVFGRPVGPFPLADFIKFADLNGTDGFSIEGAKGGAGVGYSVAGLGDINGDGLGDVAIFSGETAVGAGDAVSVIFGSKAAFPAKVAPSTLTGGTGFRVGYGTRGMPLELSAAGDVNNDGFGDILTGVEAASPDGKTLAGESFVIYGHAPVVPKPIYGTDGNDVLIGTADADLIAGRLGNDIIEGGASGDTMYGDAGFDTLSYRHAAGPVTVDFQNYALNTGEAKGDYFEGFEALMGSPFADNLRGDDNANVLTGLAGADRLWGRGGKDVFRYTRVGQSSRGAGRDIIGDFNPGTAATVIDRIDLSAIDANTCPCKPQNDVFRFIGTAPFSGRAGQLRLMAHSTGAIVQADTNGDRIADLEIKLLGVTNLSAITAADFRL